MASPARALAVTLLLFVALAHGAAAQAPADDTAEVSAQGAVGPAKAELIAKLQADKIHAVENEDYLEADRLKKKIQEAQQVGLKKKPASLEFLPAFVSSVSMIIVSELGDKTFFIAAIMAMRNSRVEVFSAAIAALALMTVLSAAMGFALPNLLPRKYTHYAAAILFVFFGIKLLKEAREHNDNEPNEELEEVEQELAESKKDAPDLENGQSARPVQVSLANKFFKPVVIQAFTMTFLAEWGDRSQIATIALAAAKDPYGVTVGGIVGHALCTGLAVMGGKLLASRISEKFVMLSGGILFLMFAAHAVYEGPDAA